MDSQKVDLFIATNSECFPPIQLPYIKSKLQEMDDSKWVMLQALGFKKPMTSLLLSIFLGSYGIDRFYIGSTGMGIGKLLTCGGFGIWTIVDLFMIRNATREANFQKFLTVL